MLGGAITVLLLGGMNFEEDEERYVTATVLVAWGRWQKDASLVATQSINLKIREGFKKLVRDPLLLHGVDCYHRILRYMTSVKWQDGRCKTEVNDMHRVENLFAKLRQKRMRWFRHIRRAEGALLCGVKEIRMGIQ